MATSLFERLLRGGTPCALLDTQYRSTPGRGSNRPWASRCTVKCRLLLLTRLAPIGTVHPAISQLPNRLFYAGQLRDDAGILERRTPPPPPPGWRERGAWPGAWRLRPVTLLALPHGREEKEGKSIRNLAEAELVVRLIVDLLRGGGGGGGGGGGISVAREIGVIAPYKAQVRLILALLASARAPAALRAALQQVEVSTVDGFQGREKDLIVVSCVRANDEARRGLGFLTDARRVNVMLTRARSGLVVVGHPPTLVRDKSVWGPWVQWARDAGLEAVQPRP
jgi:superfamily I DNA and/or RNA helicase